MATKCRSRSRETSDGSGKNRSLTTPATLNKVFGIGLPKTGTTSLANALRRLGYRTLQSPMPWMRQIYHAGIFTYPEPWDAVTNFGEWYFAQLDEWYPGSKFIWTTRPLDRWLTSVKHVYAHHHPAWLEPRLQIFGTLAFSESRMRYVYESQAQLVREYFDGRDDFLEFRVPYAWEPLCEFLGRPIPNKPYPWENRT